MTGHGTGNGPVSGRGDSVSPAGDNRALFQARRERLRRAAEDGERLYRTRMHDEPSLADDNRINGILTLDLTDALGLVDELIAVVEGVPDAVAQAAVIGARHARRAT